MARGHRTARSEHRRPEDARGHILRGEVGTLAVVMPLRTYRIVLEWDPDWPGWAVSVPALPGCFTQGKTVAEAMERVQEAIALYLESLVAHGETIPAADTDTPAVAVPVPRA